MRLWHRVYSRLGFLLLVVNRGLSGQLLVAVSRLPTADTEFVMVERAFPSCLSVILRAMAFYWLTSPACISRSERLALCIADEPVLTPRRFAGFGPASHRHR